MSRFAILMMVASAAVLAGCGSDSSAGPDETGPAYPDIEGLVTFYTFDGDYDNEVSDNHTGTPSRAVTFVDGRPLAGGGIAGQAIHVERDDYVSVPDDAALDIADAVTVAAWVNPEASDRAYAGLVDKSHDVGYSFAMWGGIADPETTYVKVRINGSATATDKIVPMGMDIWSHIGFTFDSTTGRVRFYLNGARVDSALLTGPIGDSDEDLYIGTAPGAGQYKGKIDEVAIFDRALTQEEMAELYEFE